MNEHSVNEGMFATKLDQLQVPDLQDAIWDRISDVLDSMPSDVNVPRQSGKGTIGSNRIIGWGIAGITIAIISIILIQTNKPTIKEQKQVPPTHETAPVDSPAVPSPTPDSNIITPPNFSNKKADVLIKDSLQEPLTQPRTPLGPTIQNGVRSFRTDALFADSISILPKDSIGGFNKPRGIKGLSDSSYRIVPGKKG